MDLLIKNKTHRVAEGITSIAPFSETILKYIVFDILYLCKGDTFSLVKKNVETAVVLFYGRCSIKVNGLYYENLGPRYSIFEQNPTAVYIPVNEEFTVEALDDVEVGLCYARSDKKKNPFIVRPDDIVYREIGKDNFVRKVRDIISESHDVDKLYLGETISLNGNWSSFPPHKHDRDMFPIETKLEEIYHFRIDPPQGFCIQRIYTKEKDIDETYTVENYDSVLIPKGYHPQVSCPGYKEYYLWILGGEKRQYRLFEDDNHSWIDK